MQTRRWEGSPVKTALVVAALSLSACSAPLGDVAPAPGQEADAAATDDAPSGSAGDARVGQDDANDASPSETAPDAARVEDAADAGDAASDVTHVDAVVDAPPDVAALPDAAADAPPDAALGFDCSSDALGEPTDLACTGLYSSWPSKTIAPGVVAYAPGLQLWSDGAEKSRFVLLPPGTQIDTTDMNEWSFPVGTKLWKEFRVGGKRVETRFLWKRGPSDWLRTVYAWSSNGMSATELTTGMLDVWGTGYEIPSKTACTTCHQGRIDGVLGFEAVSLAAPGASGMTMTALVASQLVTNAPTTSLAIPGNATESAALGWLHGNCGTACHNRSPSAFAGTTGLWMRLDVERLTTPAATDTYTTAVGVRSGFQPTPTSDLLRIRAGDPTTSAIPFRAGRRDDQGQGFQMPPIDTHVVDTADVALLQRWIAAMPP